MMITRYDATIKQIFKIKHNASTLGEEADLEAQTFNLPQMPIGSTNVQFSTKPAFLPNECIISETIKTETK